MDRDAGIHGGDRGALHIHYAGSEVRTVAVDRSECCRPVTPRCHCVQCSSEAWLVRQMALDDRAYASTCGARERTAVYAEITRHGQHDARVFASIPQSLHVTVC